MYKLCIEDDEGQQTIIPIIRDEITIGRQEGNTIRLTERNVSRRHARLLRQNQQVFIEEIAARYGVRKNGERISQREAFKEGDIFLIGDYRLTLQSDAPPKAASPPVASSAAPGFGAAPGGGGPKHAPRPEGTEVLPAKPAKMVVISSNFAGQEFPLTRKEMLIGRGEECDIIIDHRSVSQKHAKVVRETGSTYQIVDLNSKNGVCIAGEKYTNVHLKRGDVVELGHVKFRFVEPGENYIFTPQSVDDFDTGNTTLSSPGFGAPATSGGGKGKMIGAIIGVVLVLCVVGGLFAAGIIGGDGGKTTKQPVATKNNTTTTPKTDTNNSNDVFNTPQSSNPKVAEGITKAKSYYDNGDMKQAIATLEALNNYANPSAEDKTAIGKMLSKARAEKAFESNFTTAKTMLKSDKPLEALQAMNKIPPHSIFTKLLAEDKTKAVAGVYEMASKAYKSKEYETAKEHLGEVLGVDDSHAKAKALMQKIEDRESNKTLAVKKTKPNKTRPKTKTDTKVKPKPDKKPQKLTKEEVNEKFNAAKAAFIAGKSSTAIKNCQEVIRAKGNRDCYRILGLAYNKMGNKPKACKYLGKAVKSRPINATAIQNFMNSLGCE